MMQAKLVSAVNGYAAMMQAKLVSAVNGYAAMMQAKLSNRPAIRFLTLYAHPSDFPRHYVTRWSESTIMDGQPVQRIAHVVCLYDTREEAEFDTDVIYSGTLTWLPRMEDDDDTILGVWMD